LLKILANGEASFIGFFFISIADPFIIIYIDVSLFFASLIYSSIASLLFIASLFLASLHFIASSLFASLFLVASLLLVSLF
jgi:hypothetical protein